LSAALRRTGCPPARAWQQEVVPA